MGEGGAGEGRGSAALFLKHPLGSLFFFSALSLYDDTTTTSSTTTITSTSTNTSTSITCTHFGVLN